MPGWMKHKLESRLLEEISTTSDMQILTTLMAESEEELKILLMQVKEESEKASWNSMLKKKKKKRRPWHLIPSFHVKWKKYMQWHILISWAPKSLWMVTVTMKLKTLAPWKKSYDKLRQHIEKQRHHFAHKGLYSQNYCFFFFPVVKYACESWTKKKAECQSIDAVKLQCWRRLLRVPWTARRSNQTILKEINPEYSLEGLTLKLKLWYFGQLMQRVNSLEKTTMLGKIEGRWRSGKQRMRWLYSITNSMGMSLGKLQEI